MLQIARRKYKFGNSPLFKQTYILIKGSNVFVWFDYTKNKTLI